MQTPIELRIRKDTSFLIESSVVFGFEIPKHGCCKDLRNFKSTTLADQMMDDYVCEIGYLSRVMNREVDGAPLIQARVHCLDGRAYDARRHKDAWFAIEPCQTVKRSC